MHADSVLQQNFMAHYAYLSAGGDITDLSHTSHEVIMDSRSRKRPGIQAASNVHSAGR